MNKKLAKIMSVVMVLFAILSVFSTVLAAGPSDYIGTETDEFKDLGNDIIGMLKAIGTILAVATLIVLGIKYMMGSTEEKAEYKKTMLPYIIGAVLVFAAPYIAGFVYDWANGLSK